MDILDFLNDILWTYVLIAALLCAALWFTFKTKGAQFRMMGEMLRLLCTSGKRDGEASLGNEHHRVSSFQAFAVSIASRVGTGNLAGVATAIAIGGPGSIFWMWLIALLGSASALIESTLAQLFKIKGTDSFRGGPAYYIQKGLNKRWFAVIFAILISITFGLAFNSVQANTIVAASTLTWGASPLWVGIVLSVMTLIIIWGGIKRISRFSEIIVPIMAVFYLVLALVVVVMNLDKIPSVLTLIFEEAFTGDAVLGGGMGMALLMGIKRGLFSNEAGMGSAPNVAATASVSHPVKQGLLQSLSVFTDTIIICSCTAFIILISGLYTSGAQGIELTQVALESEVGSAGSTFVAIAIFFFAFTSIVSNYYYGETNLKFIRNSQWLVNVYRLCVSAMVLIGSLSTLDFVWAFADLTMALMTICNLIAIALLGKYAVRCIEDYVSQRRAGKDPVYRSTTIPEISDKTECWSEEQ
jgi:AGCS family alanine or glycine:cation symporter